MNIEISKLKLHPLNIELYGDDQGVDLVDSIKNKGILTPLIITKKNVIISGSRRYHAAKLVGLESVPAIKSKLTDELDIEEAIIIANQNRVKTNEQIAREFKKLKAIEKERAKLRQATSTGGKKPHLVQNSAQGEGKSREIAAAKVGVSHDTATKAEKVVDTIDDLKESGQYEEAEELRETLNKESVSKAFEESKEKKIPPKTLLPKPVFDFANGNGAWSKFTWDPVQGCKNKCPYCYARPELLRHGSFQPQFFPERLDAPTNTKLPKKAIKAIDKATGTEKLLLEMAWQNVTVCSMGELFGAWIPDEQIQSVLDTIEQHPEWNFIFLTLNPERYQYFNYPENMWLGVTATNQEEADNAITALQHLKETGLVSNIKFIAFEPLLEKITFEENDLDCVDWIIIGSQFKTNKVPKFQPEWEWVESLLFQARQSGCKVYFTQSLTVRPVEYPVQEKSVTKPITRKAKTETP